MKALLFLLILVSDGAAGYEFYLQQQNAADFTKQRADLTARIDQLTQDNQKLQAENDEATQNLSNLRNQASAGGGMVPAPSPTAPAQ